MNDMYSAFFPSYNQRGPQLHSSSLSVQTALSFLHRLSIVQVLGVKGLSENVYSSMDGRGGG